MDVIKYSKRISEYKKGFTISILLVVGIFLFLILRLWYMQLYKGDYYRNLSEKNRVRLRKIPAPRGMIFDRNGQVLVDNRPSFNVNLILEDVRDLEWVVVEASKILNVDIAEIKKKIQMNKNQPAFMPILIKKDISRDELARIESRRYELFGIEIEVKPNRSYLDNEMGASILGYTGEISQKQLNSGKFTDYKMGDTIGKSGVELTFQKFLKGEDGGKQIEVDVTGRESRVLGIIEGVPGENIYLTINKDIQKKAFEVLSGKRGAIAAVDPQTGDILAMVSTPSFDPNTLSSKISTEEWNELLTNPGKPMQNKATSGLYPPGSTFKLMIALAGLEEGVITPSTTIHCNGSFTFGNRTFRCWRKEGHGTVDLRKAIVQSCDVYFYNLGNRLGIDNIAKYSKMLGFSKATGIDLPEEKSGIIPSTEWKLKRYKVPWFPGETISCAIGQGYVNVTPLQLVMAYAALGNGGILYQPQIVKKIESADGKVIKQATPVVTTKLNVSKESLELLKNGLEGVVAEGTGGQSRILDIKVGGKTGTAQVIALGKKGLTGIEYQDHAWFVAFAPVDNPKIAVVALIEHGGHGGSASAPLVREIIKEFFRLEKEKKVGQTVSGKL